MRRHRLRFPGIERRCAHFSRLGEEDPSSSPERRAQRTPCPPFDDAVAGERDRRNPSSSRCRQAPRRPSRGRPSHGVDIH